MMKLKSALSVFWVLALAVSFLPAALAQNTSYIYTYDGPPLPIFRDSANIVSIANIFVPKAFLVAKVTATVEIDYPRTGDLNVFMYSPILTRAKLLERNCGNQGTLVNITFDDSAAAKYSDACPAAAGGSYRGNEPLSNYNGQQALGIWSLAVENNGSDDFIGYLRGFTIAFNGSTANTKPVTAPQAVFNAAGFQSAVVAPGEMINIAGVNLGPSPAVLAPAGNLPTTLGGVQVTFDGTPAALSYVSPFILTAQVPFGVTPGKKAEMRINYQGNASDPVSIDVVTVVPGVYTQNANGKGLVTAVNQDGTINSSDNRAPRGSYVTIYAAGLGTVNPALATGQIPPSSPLSNTTTVVSAVIDGYIAVVSYAGAAPGYVGLYQLNIQIPNLASSGPRELALFASGGSASQNGVFIYVQ